jgi:hypothetical protein
MAAGLLRSAPGRHYPMSVGLSARGQTSVVHVHALPRTRDASAAGLTGVPPGAQSGADFPGSDSQHNEIGSPGARSSFARTNHG